MKESERLTKEASEVDNDFTSFKLKCQALRASRSERFIEDWLPLFQARYSIKEVDYKYVITTEKFGLLDYYPKANKILVRKDNKWEKPGLKWMINNLT